MILDLVRVVPLALVLVLVPGWFWGRWLADGPGLAGRVIYAVAFSMVLVPAAALIGVRLTDGGLTLPLAVIAPAAVFLAGAGLFVWFGAAGKAEKRPAAGFPVPLAAPSLVPLALAAALVLAGDFLSQGLFWAAGSCWGWPSPACTAGGEAQLFMLPTAALVVLAGAVQVWGSRWTTGSSPVPEGVTNGRGVDSGGRAGRVLLGLVLLAVLVRGYSGPVLHDWPFIRGVDNYSHAVMANLMLSTGNDSSYLIYPPGFHLLTAEISRLSGVEPLEVFPVLAPLMMLGPTLALYALGRRMWGWQVGVAAAFFGGFLAGGIYYYFDDAMYPNLTAAQILLVMTICALVTFYSDPGWRSGISFALLGSGVVLYHQVTTLYLVVLLAPVAVFALAYLLLTSQRRAAATLFASLLLLAVLSVAFAWDTYHVPRLVAHLLDGASGTGKTASAVEMAIGTQLPYGYAVMIATTISQPIAWLGLLGVIVSTGSLFTARHTSASVLSRVTLLVWFLVMLAGSSTSLSGFPQRFGRDISVPLALFAAFALVMLLRSLLWLRGPLPVYAASAAVLLVGGLVGLRAVQSIEQAAGPSPEVTMTPQIAAAGEWLKEHNTGGNIMVSPQSNQVPSRMMLAMGHYSALQSFTAGQVAHPRDLPPHPPQRYWDVLWVMGHPQGQKTREILKRYDVRYIVLYKWEPDRPVVPYWTLFKRYPDLYRTVFENRDVLIVAPRRFSHTG